MLVADEPFSDFAFLGQSTSFSSSVFQNPAWDEAEALNQWFQQTGAGEIQNSHLQMLSTARQGGQAKFLKIR